MLPPRMPAGACGQSADHGDVGMLDRGSPVDGLPMSRHRRSAVVSFARAVVCAALAVSALTAGPALADSPQIAVVVHQASGAPSAYFTVQAQPGGQVTAGSLAIENLSDEPVSVQLAPVDALTTSTLGSAYQSPGSAVSGAARWLTLSTDSLQLAPHATGSVAVGVTVPSSATPGDYLSGVSVLSADQPAASPSAGTPALAEQYRYAVGVETQLPGARHPHLGFSGASVEREPSSVVFLLEAHNDGNVITTGVSGHATVTQAGRLVVAQAITPGSFVTGTQIAMPVRAPLENPSPGTVFRVQAELDYPGGVAYLDTLVTYGHAPAASPSSGSAGGGGSAAAPTGTGTRHPAASATAAPSPALPAAASAGPTSVPASRRPSHGVGHRRTGGRSRGRSAPVGRLTVVVPPHGRPAATNETFADALAHLARALGAVAERAAFPVLLMIVMALFFLLQDRIDRRDPKLALAPVHADPRLDFV